MIDHASTQESVPEGTKTIATFQNAREVNITNATFVLNAGAVEGPSRALGIGHMDTARTLPTVREPVSTASFTTSRSAEDTSSNSSLAGNPPHQDHISAAVLATDGPRGFHTTRHANVGSRVPLTVRADHDIYYSQLLIKGRGSPMWVPGPDLNLPEEYRREGVMIGDIGILYNLEGFSFLFNIFLPADHPINIGRVPDNFEPLDFSKLQHEVKKQTLFGRGDYLASSSVQKLDSVDSSNLIFEASATEGAVLTMPDGATTKDLMSRKSIRQYVAKNAESWYWFVREVREREVENGDIRLVVGCDRVSSWGIATFASSTEHQVRLEFRARDDVSETYMWNCVGTGSGRVGPYEEDIRDLRTDTADLKNQCVFLRTLNFNLTGEIWNNLVVHQVRSLYTSQQGDKAASGRQPGSSGEGSGGGESSSTYGVTFQASQFGSSVVHPANPINRCLMEKYPEARIAITEDEDWMSVISQQDIVFPGPDELCTRLLATREVSEEDGIVTFKTQEDSPHIENNQLSSSDSSKQSSSNSAENPRNVVADTDKQELAVTKVVPGELAIIGDPSENREIIYGDQIGMADMSVKDDPGNKKVLNSTEMLLEGPFKQVKSDAVGLQEAKSFYFIPPLLVLYFVGRETLYARLQALFDCATTASAPSIVVLTGMGGVGKTQLALEYCRRMKNSGKFRGIFWLDASSRDTLYNSMETVAKHLIPDRVFDNPDAAVASVNDVLSTWSEQWLLVFDNLDNPEDLPGILSFFPASHRGSILITSRLAASKKLGQSIEVDCMEREEGLQLLLVPSRGDTDEVDAAEEILSLLGSLPLAIDQARAYISKRRLGLRVFLTEYERRKQSVMQETPRHWQYRRVLQGKEKEVSLNLLTTWEMSLQLLGVGEQAAELEKVITLFAFFNPVNIGERLFNNDVDGGNPTSSPMTIFKDDGRWDHLKFENAVVKMQDLSLLQFSHCNESEIAVSLHPMVSEWLRMRLDKSSQSTFLNTAILHLQSHLGSIGHSDHKTRQEAQAHLDTIWRGVESFNLDDHILEACITFGNFYRDQGCLKDAEMVYNRALAGCESVLGHKHTSTLDTVNNLGLLYIEQGRCKDAETMYNRALAGYEEAFGPEHPSTLGAVNNLGLLYIDQGRLKDAETMYNRALAGYEKAFGPEHPSTLGAVNNLGLLYIDQGRLKDAETMYNRALAGYENAFGPEHTSTLNTVNNLGLLYSDQGRLKDAEVMYDRALAGYEKALGPEHTSTLNAVNNLGLLYSNQGRLKDAETMYNRALAGYEKAFGPEHISTFGAVNNLGLLYSKQGRYQDAEMLYNRALAGYEKALDPEHTSTLNAVNNLGLLYTDQGRYKDAEMMYARALAGREKALGPEHTSTLSTVNHLGILYTNQGRLKEAEMTLNRALAGKEKAWGPEHPSTFITAKKEPQNVFEDYLNTPLIGEFGTNLSLPLFLDFEKPHKAEESVLKPISTNVPFRDLTPIEQATQSHLRTFHVGGGAVTSGTLEGLVQFLIIGFGMPGHCSYRDTFLTACSELTTPEDLFNILSRRLSEEPHTSNEGCGTQYTIFVFIVFWLSSNCFSPNEELLYRIKFFCEEVIRSYPSLNSIAEETRQLIDLEIFQMAQPAPVWASTPHEPILRISDTTPSDLAIALGLLEGDYYKALQPFDYLQHLSKGPSDRVRICITTNEKIRQWVIKSILYYDTVSSQSEVFKFFTKTAFECYSMRNFSSTAAISTALQSAVVGNLKATMTTWKGASKKTQAKLRVICDIIHPHSNYRGYYEAIRSAATAQEMGTCIPWLALHLKELYKVVRQPLTVMVDNQHLINFTRHNQFMDRIKEILYYSPPDLEDRRHGGQLTYLLNQLHDIDLSGNSEQQLLTKSEMFSTREEKRQLAGF